MTDTEPKREIPSRLQLAGCIIQNPEGKILLIHRNTPKRAQWEVLGGKNERGEPLQVTAVREAGEELGIGVAIKGKLGEHEFEEDGFVNNYTWYEATIISGEPKIMELPFDQFSYYSWEELRNMRGDLSANAKNLVDVYFVGQLKL
jgi:8-oxo-dGTP pyrophosphatase MutT (NUDIX family)